MDESERPSIEMLVAELRASCDTDVVLEDIALRPFGPDLGYLSLVRLHSGSLLCAVNIALASDASRVLNE